MAEKIATWFSLVIKKKKQVSHTYSDSKRAENRDPKYFIQFQKGPKQFIEIQRIVQIQKSQNNLLKSKNIQIMCLNP